MPRSNWKGVISFGLVNIPISLFNSEDTSERVAFHQIDKRNYARIKYQRVNEETGKEVPWENIIKGYVYNKDTVLPVEEDELKKVAGENARTIAIEHFVKEDSIDFVDINKTYYLVPDKKGEKGYVILRQALKQSKMMGIAKVIISTKEYLAALACYKNALVLYLLRYESEIKPLSEFDIPSDDLKKSKVNTKEINTALLLIKSMTSKWTPKKYKDEYQEVVRKWAENRIKHKSPIVMQPRSKSTESRNKKIDYINLLRKSLTHPKQRGTKQPSMVQHAKRRSNTGKRPALH